MAACAQRRHNQDPRVCPSAHVPAAGPASRPTPQQAGAIAEHSQRQGPSAQAAQSAGATRPRQRRPDQGRERPGQCPLEAAGRIPRNRLVVGSRPEAEHRRGQQRGRPRAERAMHEDGQQDQAQGERDRAGDRQGRRQVHQAAAGRLPGHAGDRLEERLHVLVDRDEQVPGETILLELGHPHDIVVEDGGIPQGEPCREQADPAEDRRKQEGRHER